MLRRIKFDENNHFFLSISDLIMGVLLIFVLLYVRENAASDVERVRMLEEENGRLKIELQQVQKQIKISEEEISNLKADNKIFKEELEKKKAENGRLRIELQQMQKQIKISEEEISELKADNKVLKEELEEKKAEIRKFLAMIATYKDTVTSLQKKEATIEEFHQKINLKLQEAFKDDSDIKIDTINQELILDDSVLFGVNEWMLKEIGKEKLRKILPKFFSTFVDDDTVVNFLEQLTVEGHTDDLGSSDPQRNYLYNLDLSQKRAYEVARFIYSDSHLIETLGEERLKKLKIYLSSNGKSNANLIYKDLNKKIVDRDKSRRVTIKYRLDIQKMLKNPSGGI